MKITRRTFAAGLSVAALAVSAGKSMLAAKEFRRPNVILFVADDMRFDAAGFAGNTIIKTSHLDALAAQGFVFDNNFVTTSVCPVSRGSIMTGDYALRHRVYDFNTPIAPNCYAHSLPVLMKKAGYHTGFIGKWGIGGIQPITDFSRWDGFEGQGVYFPAKDLHMTDLQTIQAHSFLKNLPADKPFFLVVCYKAPHTPLLPQPRFSDLYVNDVLPRAKSDTRSESQKLSPLMQQSATRLGYIGDGFDSDVSYQQKMKNYYRLITGIDDSVGSIVEHLKHARKFADTSILFTSDNGMLEGEHGLEGKWCMYEESIRVPFMMRLAPNHYSHLKPAHIKAMSLNIDIAPTILEMAEIPVPQHVRGASMLALAKNQDAPGRGGFYYEHPGWPRQKIWACEGYRGTEWKYSRYTQEKVVEEFLFNLTKDPAETTDLAKLPEYHAVLEQMRRSTAKEREEIMSA